METAEIGILIGLIFAAMFALAAALIIFHINYRSNLLKSEKEKDVAAFKAAIEAEEREKEKMAANLHDEIIPLLIVVGHHVERNLLDHAKGGIDPANLKNEMVLIQQSINSIRAMALDMIPKTLLNFGLVKALEQYITSLNQNSASDNELLDHTLYYHQVPFSKSEQVNIYRICLEILNNLQKHARYSYLSVSLNSAKDHLNITFEHDGAGVDNEAIEQYSRASAGLGLKSLRSRLLILNAGINYSVSRDSAIIYITIPISR